MKFCKRILCVLLACSCFLSVSLVSANADEVDHSAYYIYTVANATGKNGTANLLTGMHYPMDSTRQYLYAEKLVETPNSGFYVSMELYVANNDKTPLYNSGSVVTGKLENLYIYGTVDANVAMYPLEFDGVIAYLLYADGTTGTATASITKDRNGYYVIDFSFEAKKDVSQIMFVLTDRDFSQYCNNKTVEVRIQTGEPSTDLEPNNNIVWGNLYSDVQSAEVSWLAKIWQKLSNGFENMVNAIVNLPAQIWGFIEDGLKSLFVPDEAFIASYKDKWEQLLSDKLGAVWQVVEVTFGSWEEINVSDEQNTIAIPKVSIPLPEDNEFSFGPYDVKIVPDGFEFLATAVKAITGILSTFLFINGVRKRYDEVMGVEQ